MHEIAQELKFGDGDKWMNFLVPGYEFDKKVDDYRRNKKQSKIKKTNASNKRKVRSGAPKSKNKHEEKVREILENYYDDYFPTCRPKFLKNPKTGRCLELDGYNARLNLAFEYQGVQHRKYTPRFHKDYNDFEKQLYRDQIKKKILKSLEIKLLEIPDTIKYDDLEDYVLSLLKTS